MAISAVRSCRVGARPALSGVMILAATLTGCAASPDNATRPPAPRPAPVVRVSMLEHRFELDRPVPAGRVVFRFDNAGQAPHNVVMIPLAEDLPPIDVQLRGSQRRVVEPFAGIYDREPGDTGSFAVDLVADQRYAIVCTVTGEDGQPHWMHGMAAEFRTPPAPAPAGTTTTASRP